MFKQQVRYEDPSLGDKEAAEVNPYQGMEIATARWAGELLERNYPGHPWHVEVQITNRTGGIIKVRLGGIMPPDRWWITSVDNAIHDVGGKKTVLRGAGELLERYQLSRGRFSVDDWRLALNKSPIIGRGHLDPLN